MDVIHSFCASLNGLDTSIDRYKYNHSPPTIKCTVLCFRLMIFLSIEKNGWASFLIFRCFLLPFFIHFPLLYLPLPPLSATVSLSVTKLFCYFYETAFHLCKCTAGFYFLFNFFTLLFIGNIQSRSTCNAAWIPYCDAQVTSGLGSITLPMSKLRSSQHLPEFDLTDQTY